MEGRISGSVTRQKVEERRVVVLRQIDRVAEGQNLISGQRVVAIHQQLVPEDPLVPDVHTSIP